MIRILLPRSICELTVGLEQTFPCQLSTKLDSQGVINIQHIDRNTSNRCAADEHAVSPTKMANPFLLAWIEEWYDAHSLSIKSSDVGSLE